MQQNWLSLRSGSDIHGYAEAADGHTVELTKEFAQLLGYSFALWLAQKQDTTPDKLVIAVGHDSRLSSPALSKGIIHGLTCADCDVFDCGLTTTPAMFLTMIDEEIAANGAVMVTASYMKGELNGFKFFAGGDGLDGGEIEEVIKGAQSAVLPHRLVTGLDLTAMYSRALREMVADWMETDEKKPLLGISVVVDAANGVGGFYAELLEELGADVTGSYNLAPDGHFPDHAPDPQLEAPIAQLTQAVLDNEADFGVTFDADCNRASIVGPGGRPIMGNRLIALCAAILLEEYPGATIVTDSVTSSGLARFITESGGTHYRFKRGYRDVIDEAVWLNEEGINCPIAIETTGHAALREHHFIDDGMYLATWILVEALRRKRNGQTIEELIDWLQEPVESCEIRMRVVGKDVRESAAWIIQKILSHTLNNPAWHLAPDNREGARINFDLDGQVDSAWFQLRLSVHDPVMALNAQSDVAGGVNKILGELYELLKDDEDELDLTKLKAYIYQ